MSSGLGEVGEGSRAQSKLKFPIEKDNICELGEPKSRPSIGLLPRLPCSPALLHLMLHGVLAGAVTCWTWKPSAGGIR
jgi:hypothetical protein